MHGHPTTSRRLLAITVSALFLFGALVVWLPMPAEAATTRTLTITTETAKPQVPFAKFDGNPLKVFDINGDGKLEIIAQNDNQWVYVFDSKTGAILFEAKTTFPPNWGARSFNGPEVAVMDQDGSVRLIVANSAAFITSYKFEPASSTNSKFTFVKEWERRLNDCYSGAGMDAKPVLADLDKDGRFEILGATEQLGLYALRDDGSLYWKNCLGGGNAEPIVADVDLDGWPDVVHASDGGKVALLNGRTGGWIWSYNILKHPDGSTNFDLGSASIPVGAAVGQLDGVGGLDIVVGVRDSHDAVDYSQNHAMLLTLDSGGKLLWSYQDPTGNPLTYTHPIIGDAAKDGKREVYWADWNTMGHKPGEWEREGPGNFYRLDAAGNLVWKQTLGTFWSNKDLAIADVTGDGVQDMLANGPASNGHDGIWYLDTRTGEKQQFVDAWPYKVMRSPIVADLWNTGTTQWAIQVAPYGDGSADGIQIYDTGVAYNAMYPHLPYPTLGPAASPPPTTAPDTKEAESFVDKTAGGRQSSSIASGGAFWNLWSNGFIQDNLESDGTSDLVVVARGTSAAGVWPTMVVTVDGKSPRTFHVSDPAFTEYRSAAPAAGVHKIQIQFTNDLRTEAEDRNLHLDVVRLTGAATTPPPATFAATFTVTDDVHNYWVSVRVESSDEVSKVSAIVNDGAMKPLEEKSWGPWAASFFVATCSKVQFSATSAGGDQVLSQTFKWLDSGECGEDTPFSATFTPRNVGSDWWVATKVSASETVTRVDARLNGGAWTELDKTEWDWAKSLHAPDGTTVEFRATGSSGDTVTSGTTIWT